VCENYIFTHVGGILVGENANFTQQVGENSKGVLGDD